jgi:hypothetical protein
MKKFHDNMDYTVSGKALNFVDKELASIVEKLDAADIPVELEPKECREIATFLKVVTEVLFEPRQNLVVVDYNPDGSVKGNALESAVVDGITKGVVKPIADMLGDALEAGLKGAIDNQHPKK